MIYYSKNMSFTDLNRLVEQQINEFMENNDMDSDEDRAGLINLLQSCGVQFDACSLCGSMPMNSNCNNAGCDS